MPHFVYIIESKRNGRYYIGSSADPKRRLLDHNAGKVKATLHLLPWILVYTEEFAEPRTARQREWQLKSMKSRKYLEALMQRSVG